MKHSLRKVLVFSHAEEAVDPGNLPSGVTWQTADVSSSESAKRISRTAKEQFGSIYW